MLDITKAFNTDSKTISGFFQEPGLGFYIPLYQREYSWDQENIDQLMEDIIQGVDNIRHDTDDIRFLGSVIRVKENNPRVNINPRDTRAFPTRIDNVIDGQQRITTIALLGTLLYQHLDRLRSRIPDSPPFNVVHSEIVPQRLKVLIELFTVDLGRGTPHRKPIVIRGSKDAWTLDGADDEYYVSEIASYIAKVIRVTDANKPRARYPKLPSGHQVAKNLRRMDRWLKKIESAHLPDDDEEMSYPSAWMILEYIDQVHIWDYDRDDLVDVVVNHSDTSKVRDYLISLVQLLAFTHYLLDRCCFNVIDPSSDAWAFDMFQSLNATGTPLTAVETFKPAVVNSVEYKGSMFETYFGHVDELLTTEKSVRQKSRMTDLFLTDFAHIYDGTKLPRRFSTQRKWLIDQFDECQEESTKLEFMRRMANLAEFLNDVFNYDHSQISLPQLNHADRTDREVSSMCTLYLHDAGHKMARTILSLFYARIIRNEANATSEFVAASKAVAAFFTLWRSALPNKGLDDVYRQILKGVDSPTDIKSMAWSGNLKDFSATNLKKHLRYFLKKQGIEDKSTWLPLAQSYFRYDSAARVCRFGLFLTSQNTEPDPSNLGLMRQSRDRTTYNYMTTTAWHSEDFRTLEHVAPATQSDGWDKTIYEEDLKHSIGNLTLLPTEINSSASNREWKTKLIYYKHLAETNDVKLRELAIVAEQNDVELHEDTIELLRNSKFNDHMRPIVSLDTPHEWNASVIKARTERICEIMWLKLSSWLDY